MKQFPEGLWSVRPITIGDSIREWPKKSPVIAGHTRDDRGATIVITMVAIAALAAIVLAVDWDKLIDICFL